MNSSQSDVTSWRAAPTGRGTFNLVFSCVVTLSLCVYTALHLNVPGQKDGKRRRLFRKLKWSVFGVFAPEIVVFNAWSQWRAAKKLSWAFEDSMRSKDFSVQNWTMTHSFFAGMGGYAVDTRPSLQSEHNSIQNSPRLTVKGPGALILARHGCLPDLSEENILDRSKADTIAKALSCIQAGWLVVQCIARLASRLPVTQLEVVTLAHCLCAFAMYLLWWDKPLDICEPVLLDRGHLRQITTLLFQENPLEGGIIGVRTHRDVDAVEGLTILPDLDETQLKLAVDRVVLDYRLPFETEDLSSSTCTDNPTKTREPYLLTLRSTNWDSKQKHALRSITTVDRHRRMVVIDRREILSWLAFTLATACYGGLHSAAWFSFFPTRTETLLWRISALYITCAGVLTPLFSGWFIFMEISNSLDEFISRPSLKKTWNAFHFILWACSLVVFGLLLGAYVAARAFLVLEALISLRLLPVAAYETPPWTQWIPHF